MENDDIRNLYMYPFDTIINRIFYQIEINNNKFVIFADWNNMISETYNGNYVFRNGNIKTSQEYNRILNNPNCLGFYILICVLDDPADIIFNMQNLELDTTLIMEKNNIDTEKNYLYTDQNDGYDYEITYGCLIKPLKCISSNIIINDILNKYYINILNKYDNYAFSKVEIYFITSSVCKVIENLLYKDIFKYIMFIPTLNEQNYILDTTKKNKCNVNDIYEIVNSIKSKLQEANKDSCE